MIACRSSLRCKPVFITEINNLELSAIELNTNFSEKVLIVSIYRPPNTNIRWIYNFVDFLNRKTYAKVILVGDFNFPNITWLDGSGFCNSDDSALSKFCQCLTENNLFQLINPPTRNDNYLDLFTNIVDHVINRVTSLCYGSQIQFYPQVSLTYNTKY